MDLVSFLSGSDGKESACISGEMLQNLERPRFGPQARKIHWRRARQSTPVFLPGESHGQRRLVGYSSGGHKESDTTELLTLPFP